MIYRTVGHNTNLIALLLERVGYGFEFSSVRGSTKMPFVCLFAASKCCSRCSGVCYTRIGTPGSGETCHGKRSEGEIASPIAGILICKIGICCSDVSQPHSVSDKEKHIFRGFLFLAAIAGCK